MHSGLSVRHVRFVAACAGDRAAGLLGWVSCSLGAVRLDGIAVRRTRKGRSTLSFPRGRGHRHPVRPIDDEARKAIEREVFAAIKLPGGGTR